MVGTLRELLPRPLDPDGDVHAAPLPGGGGKPELVGEGEPGLVGGLHTCSLSTAPRSLAGLLLTLAKQQSDIRQTSQEQ